MKPSTTKMNPKHHAEVHPSLHRHIENRIRAAATDAVPQRDSINSEPVPLSVWVWAASHAIEIQNNSLQLDREHGADIDTSNFAPTHNP